MNDKNNKVLNKLLLEIKYTNNIKSDYSIKGILQVKN